MFITGLYIDNIWDYYSEDGKKTIKDPLIGELLFQGVGEAVDYAKKKEKPIEDIETVKYYRYRSKNNSVRYVHVDVILIEQPDNEIYVYFQESRRGQYKIKKKR